MDIIEESFRTLYPDRTYDFDGKIKYSGKFSAFNANVKLRGKSLTFCMSRNWREVSTEIKSGLIQTLMLKLFSKGDKQKVRTTNIDLYNMFLKNVHLSIAKNDVDPLLSERFDLLNEKYFNGMLDKPNLVWGEKTYRKLGSYEYGKDTIMISGILQSAKMELIDYVLYHEMLHKKLKFNNSGIRSRYHTTEFKEMEGKFPNSKLLEEELAKLARKKRFFELF